MGIGNFLILLKAFWDEHWEYKKQIDLKMGIDIDKPTGNGCMKDIGYYKIRALILFHNIDFLKDSYYIYCYPHASPSLLLLMVSTMTLPLMLIPLVGEFGWRHTISVYFAFHLCDPKFNTE